MLKMIADFERKFAAHPVCANMVIGIISGVVAGCIINILLLLSKTISLSISIGTVALIILITVIFYFIE